MHVFYPDTSDFSNIFNFNVDGCFFVEIVGCEKENCLVVVGESIEKGIRRATR